MSDNKEVKKTLAKAILDVSYSMERLLADGLNRSAIIVLIADDTGLSKKTITKILDSLGHLRDKYSSGAV
jgi:hypothetical protein